jgi:adenylosuccinate synthase
MVIDPWVLRQELDNWLQQTGEDPSQSRLFISERAHIILPYHRMLDSLDEKIGTTGRGIGPTYADKINRIGLRFGDLSEVIGDVDWAETVSLRMNSDLSAAGAEGRIEAAQLAQEVAWIHDTFGQTVANTGVMLDNALKLGENVLLEGAQGCLLDIDQGTYPFVTSSVTSRGNATHGAGIHPGHIEQVIGIVKAYTTRVGAGPMPSELFDSDGDHMTDVGHEFGTTTGRRRRCGWLDLVVLRHANRVNGFTSMAMTKLDVLGGIDPLKICVGYRLDGKEIHEMPASSAALARCEPILIEMPGFPPEPLEVWLDLAKKADVEGLGYSALPSAAQAYIGHVENLLGVPITSVGIGPDRDATIERAD